MKKLILIFMLLSSTTIKSDICRGPCPPSIIDDLIAFGSFLGRNGKAGTATIKRYLEKKHKKFNGNIYERVPTKDKDA